MTMVLHISLIFLIKSFVAEQKENTMNMQAQTTDAVWINGSFRYGMKSKRIPQVF